MSGKIKIDWGESIKNFKWTTKQTAKYMEKEMYKIIRQTTAEILADVKKHTPVLTGAAKRAWSSVQKGHKRATAEFWLVNDKDYAIFIEHGTYYIAPRNMLQKAMNKGAKKLVRKFKELEKRTARRFNT